MNAFFLAVLLCASSAAAAAGSGAADAPPSAPPDLSTAVWVNTPGPLSLQALRGRVVVLEFSDQWSGTGERSLLEAQAAQAAHPDSSALVSVRTRAAGDPSGPEALAQEALRRRIITPMVEDPARELARAYSVEDLPAVVLLDARGRFARRYGPADSRKELWKEVGALVDRARSDHDLWTATGPAAPVWDRYAEGPLAFPTGLAYDAASDLLAVCDTGHDRVVVSDGLGRVRFVAGRGAPGYRDGRAAQAGFDRPRAAAFLKGQLAVADSANDYIRVVQLPSRKVASWFGEATSFSWPSSLLIAGRTVYFGSSGTHQLWAVDLDRARRYLLAGDGVPGDRDGLPPVARLREPAALAMAGDTLYIADPEAGLLRAVSVSTPALATPALRGTGAPLKRPMALAALDGKLFIADAGDGSLKRLDPATNEVTVLARGLRRPSGLAAFKGGLLLAETDASRLLRFSVSGKPLGELRLRGLKGLPKGPPQPPLAPLPPGKAEELPPQPARAGVLDTVEIALAPPAGMVVNPRAPATVRFEETLGRVTVPPGAQRDSVLPPGRALRLRFKPAEGKITLLLEVSYFYCREGRKGLCFPAFKRYRLPVAASTAEKSRIVRVSARP